ncbi:MAG: hypothetical protein ACFB21_04255 [Opitutales bacterium]
MVRVLLAQSFVTIFLTENLVALPMKNFTRYCIVSFCAFFFSPGVPAQAQAQVGDPSELRAQQAQLKAPPPATASIETNGFRFDMVHAVAKGNKVEAFCRIISLEENQRLHVCGNDSANNKRSRLIDAFGEEYFPEAVTLGRVEGRRYAINRLTRGVPIKITLFFELEATDLAYFPLVEFLCRGGPDNEYFRVSFRDVPIERR